MPGGHDPWGVSLLTPLVAARRAGINLHELPSDCTSICLRLGRAAEFGGLGRACNKHGNRSGNNAICTVPGARSLCAKVDPNSLTHCEQIGRESGFGVGFLLAKSAKDTQDRPYERLYSVKVGTFGNERAILRGPLCRHPRRKMERIAMKPKSKKRPLTFGDLVAASYRAWGARRAKGLVRLAVNAHLVVFRGRQHFVISEEQHENLLFKSNRE